MSSKRYSEEFKIEAVKQVTERGYSVAAPVLALIGLIGPSYQVHMSGVVLSEIAGFSSQHVMINGFDLIQMPYAIVREGVITREGTHSIGEVFTSGSLIFPSNSYEGVGSWLVKPAVVPAPPALLLFLTGVLPN